MANLQAPPINEIRVTKLAGHFAQIEWDRIGSNFRYEVQLRSAASVANLGGYRRLGYTENIYYFMDDDIIQPGVVYQFRVRAVYKGFDPGEWTVSDTYLSQTTNAYTYETQDNFVLSNSFKKNFFASNDKSYVDIEAETLYATLVRPGFTFDPTMEWYNEAGASFVYNNGFQMLYGEVPVVCHSQERVIPTVIDDVIYAFERYQSICKVSNDGGQNWYVYAALRGRAGNPVVNCIAQQNTNNTYVLGWDYIYRGIPSLDLTFDNNIERWSTVEYTFDKLDVENEFGFDTERFTPLCPLPTTVTQKAEAFAVDNYQVVVTALDKVYEYKVKTPKIEDDPLNSNYGSRVFENTEYRITNVANAVTKKVEFYSDPTIGTDLGTFYFLVPGKWIFNEDINSDEFGKKIGIDDSIPERGVYRLNRTTNLIPNPEYNPSEPTTEANPVWLVTGFTIDPVTPFTRVYGNTAAERVRITSESTLSRDEKYLLLGVELQGWDVVVDPNTPEGASSAVRYYKEQLFTAYQQRRLQAIGTTNGTTWKPVPQDYYGSANFNWMARSGTRDFKDWSNVITYIRPKVTYTVPFSDLSTNRWTHSFSEGVHTINAPDLTISEFSGYTDGALIHTEFGRMLGYYSFAYRISTPAEIAWNPTNQMLVATLTDYVAAEVEVPVADPTDIIDPDISPLLQKMVPESYIAEDGLYKKFSEYYLKFISRGEGTAYNNLYNLMNSKWALDKHYTEYLYKEIYARNRILDSEKRAAVTQFFLARRNDFYSTKGIINSYKFLFKLLYDLDVELEVESLNRFEYYIMIDSNDMTDDMVGRRIYTTTGSADVTYYERVYTDGVLYYKLTLNNLMGSFTKGQVIKTEWDPTFVAMVQTGVKGDTTDYNSEDFKKRSKAYYVMKIRSELQTAQYKSDIVRFIHPVGFGFIGITLLTVLINQGLSIEHIETIVDFYNSLRFDMGAGTVYPEMTPLLDGNGEIMFVNGVMREVPHPKAGLDFLVDRGITETQYNAYWDNSTIWGLTPYERRGTYSPTFDVSWVRWSELVTKLSERLKDNIGGYYDPTTPGQKWIGE